MARNRGGGSSARSSARPGGLFGRKQEAAPARPAPPPPQPASHHQQQHHAPPPAAAHPAPAPAPVQSGGGGMLSGLGGMVMQGMAVGTGSAIAHRAVGAIASSFGGSSEAPSAPQPVAAAPQQSYNSYPQTSNANPNDVCSLNQQDLYRCLQEQNGNAGACQFYFDALRQCQDNQMGSTNF